MTGKELVSIVKSTLPYMSMKDLQKTEEEISRKLQSEKRRCDKSSPLVVAFWDGKSHGTEDMINKARAAGLECVVVPYSRK